MAQDSNLKPSSSRLDRELVWAILGAVYAALSGVVLGYVYDAIVTGNQNGNLAQIWAILAPLVVFILLNLPALVISLRSLRRAAKSSVPLAVTIISVIGLVINVWVIVRVLIVLAYVLFLTGRPADTGTDSFDYIRTLFG